MLPSCVALPSEDSPRGLAGESVRPPKKVNIGEKMSSSPRFSGLVGIAPSSADEPACCLGCLGLCVMNSLADAGVPGSRRRLLAGLAPSAEGDHSIFESEVNRPPEDTLRCAAGATGVEVPPLGSAPSAEGPLIYACAHATRRRPPSNPAARSERCRSPCRSLADKTRPPG